MTVDEAREVVGALDAADKREAKLRRELRAAWKAATEERAKHRAEIDELKAEVAILREDLQRTKAELEKMAEGKAHAQHLAELSLETTKKWHDMYEALEAKQRSETATAEATPTGDIN